MLIAAILEIWRLLIVFIWLLSVITFIGLLNPWRLECMISYQGMLNNFQLVPCLGELTILVLDKE